MWALPFSRIHHTGSAVRVWMRAGIQPGTAAWGASLRWACATLKDASRNLQRRAASSELRWRHHNESAKNRLTKYHMLLLALWLCTAIVLEVLWSLAGRM